MLASSRISSSSAAAPLAGGRQRTRAVAASKAAPSTPLMMTSLMASTCRRPIFVNRRFPLPPRPSLRSVAAAAAPGEVSTTTKPLELHVGPTTLTLPFNQQRAAELKAALALLLATFAEKAKAERPKRWQSLEYRFENEDGDGGETPPGLAFFEAFCNPNAAASPFDAKVLVTVRSTGGGVGFTTEAPLSALRADLEAY